MGLAAANRSDMKFLLESMTVLGFSSYLVHTRLGKAGQNK